MARPVVLVAGFSARALARSAMAAGFEVVSLDGFGDRDLVELEPRPRAHVTVRPFLPSRAAQAGAALAADAVAWTSNFENHPLSLGQLAAGRPILGNTPMTLRQVRDPRLVENALREAGTSVPRVLEGTPDQDAGWMVKPRKSGGGRGVRPWQPGDTVARGEYLQERVDGTPGSLVFLADGREAHPVALTRQVVGEPRLGGWGCCYAGSTLASRAHPLFEDQDDVHASACRAAAALVRAFGLVGLNTVDFMARDGVAWPIEVNPRHSASMELVERELGASLFGLHVDAVHGTPPQGLHDPLGWAAVPGKAIVYARRGFDVGGGDGLLGRPEVADLSPDGTHIPAGAPVCTVFARDTSHERCLDALVARGRAVLSLLQHASEVA